MPPRNSLLGYYFSFPFLFSLLVAVFAHFRAFLYLLFSYFAYDMDNN